MFKSKKLIKEFLVYIRFRIWGTAFADPYPESTGPFFKFSRSNSESFDPKLTSFLIQIRARMYMYSIHPSTGR